MTIPAFRLRILSCTALLFGGGSLFLFGIFLFFGPFRIVDMGMTESGKLFFNAGLSLLFFVQHSLMVRQSFRLRMRKIIPEYAYPAFYALVSGIVLLAAVILWQPSYIMLAQASGMVYGILCLLFLLSVLGFFCASASLRYFDPFGTGKISDYLNSRASLPPAFSFHGLYTRIRHPFYFFTLLMIWTCPNLSADRLLFNILWSLWIIAGAVWEERDLVRVFGDEYRAYQQKTRMLIPVLFPISDRKNPEK
ncbi:MAG: isoprenylcysteine carboxylmethyltransferase family protein [Desulfococcaceae bacterium]